MFRKYPSDPLPQVPAPDAAVDTLLGVQLLGSFLKSRHVLFTLWLLREGAMVERGGAARGLRGGGDLIMPAQG